ncbi:DUF4625 domain-containing protein [Anditalea andensis]|uniref:DUF4625 domain-containing protein n=1 Tax=Anditalea andensis TaxID=1048983 RepID=A0A074KRR9_9BACT|nr:DUF4625 domain-containing protein [Anditalea andensis]KEO72631.1 hypothetical protein EL17_17995 [Anditalea andensis]
MKKYLTLSALAAITLFSCNNDDDSIRDMEAPVIAAAEGRDEIRPRHGEIMRATSDHMHVRFSVKDPSGIQEVRIDVHSVSDGHTHGRLSNDFVPLTLLKIIPLDGVTFYNQDDHETDIYWVGENSPVQGNILAGPYDFIIDAVDIHSNVTTHAEGNNYSTTIYIERPYGPEMTVTNLQGDELEGTAGQPLVVQGSVNKGNDPLSSDIRFLWVRLAEEEHDGHGHAHGEDVYERMWGTSQWRQHSNGNFYSGSPIPAGTAIDFSQAFTGDNAIVLPAGEEHYELIIWAEDVNGNVTRRTYEVHAH